MINRMNTGKNPLKMNIHISPTDKPFYVLIFLVSVIIVLGEGGMTGFD